MLVNENVALISITGNEMVDLQVWWGFRDNSVFLPVIEPYTHGAYALNHWFYLSIKKNIAIFKYHLALEKPLFCDRSYSQ